MQNQVSMTYWKNKYWIYLSITSWFVSEELLAINFKPVRIFKRALMHRANSSCRNVSENFARLRSLSFSRTSINDAVSPPSSRNSSGIYFVEHLSSFRIKPVYVLNEELRTLNLINSSGSTLYKLCPPFYHRNWFQACWLLPAFSNSVTSFP